MNAPVLLVDDDVAVREALSQTLDLAGFVPIAAGSFVAAKDHITRGFGGVILSDIRMPGRDGFHLLNYAQKVDADLPVVLLTGEGDIPMAVTAMEHGAFDFLEKPCATQDLIAVLNRATKNRKAVLAARLETERSEAGDPAARLIFGQSALAIGLRARVRQVAHANSEVLVIGAPGSGISKIAEVIHLCSDQARGPFEKRASDGLDRGGLKQALAAGQGGAIFLDEISRMPADTQIALIEALEQGGNVRVMLGSTEPLSPKRINSELYYRIETNTVRIPSLSERPEDISVMFHLYAEQASEQAGLTLPEITAEHLARLMARDWPGNARSLMSEAMRFVLGVNPESEQGEDLGLAEQMARVERSLLVAALTRTNGQAAVAAVALKLPRKTFYDKLSRFGLRPEDFRDQDQNAGRK